MKIIHGNILNVKNGIIGHQTNTIGKAGAGLAKQIRDKWPKWYDNFRDVSADFRLGDFGVFQVWQSVWVANLYGQATTGYRGRKTNYGALAAALCKLDRALESMFARGTRVYLPYGLGCGLAKGDWMVVSELIDHLLPDAIVVRLPDGYDPVTGEPR